MRRVHLILALAVGVFLLAGAPVVIGQAQMPDTVILKGNPMGGVKFPHKLHAEQYAHGKCDTCHHASKPEKPLKSPQEKCTDCHTKTAVAPMKTKLQAAFHNPMAKTGICIDCHVKENKAGKHAPTTCTGCHKKENK